eukprot:1156599-Pelagomonas_calceolata.AAC.1
MPKGPCCYASRGADQQECRKQGGGSRAPHSSSTSLMLQLGCSFKDEQLCNPFLCLEFMNLRISILDQARRTSSRPDAILVTPCPANPNSLPTLHSHQVLRSMRRNDEVRSSTTPARQLRELNIQNRHIHLIEIKL